MGVVKNLLYIVAGIFLIIVISYLTYGLVRIAFGVQLEPYSFTKPLDGRPPVIVVVVENEREYQKPLKASLLVETVQGVSCDTWDNAIDKATSNDTERSWLKRVMRCESRCRAGVVNSLGYTGLFQWSPYYWQKQFPNDDIFDGYAQIRNSLWKYRMGGAGIWVCK